MSAAKVRFTVISFSDVANCVLELADLRHIEEIPRLAIGGGTAYSSAFVDLRGRIDSNVTQLQSDEYLVNRPAVFFLTDGMPNSRDPWESTLADLVSPDFKRRPNILAFGFNEADPAVIIKVATKEQFAFMAAKGSDTGEAIKRFFVALTQSIVSSGQALANGSAELPMERPEGFTMAVDVLD
jgi:uncharacterized protein YegL